MELPAMALRQVVLMLLQQVVLMLLQQVMPPLKVQRAALLIKQQLLIKLRRVERESAG